MKITSNRLLLVEGKDEVNLLNVMMARWNVEGVQVVDLGGKDRFKAKLDALLSQLKSRNITPVSIGVLRDADDSPSNAFQSVTDALRSSVLPVPKQHGSFVQGHPSVGIFILPDNDAQGSIENLCWESVKALPAGLCSTSYLECLQDADALKSNNIAKTLVHAYLAAQDDPSVRVGEGALKGYWPVDHPIFTSLKGFLFTAASI